MKTFLQVSILVEDDYKKKLKRMLVDKDKTMTAFIQFLVDKYIDEQKEKGEWNYE